MRVGNNLCVCVCSVVSNSLQPHGPPGSSVQRILQARILEWVAISYSKGSSWLRDRTGLLAVSPALVGEFFAPEPPGKPLGKEVLLFLWITYKTEA